jgi:hypothetical protein
MNNVLMWLAAALVIAIVVVMCDTGWLTTPAEKSYQQRGWQ